MHRPFCLIKRRNLLRRCVGQNDLLHLQDGAFATVHLVALYGNFRCHMDPL